MQFLDAQKALCRKLNIEYSDIALNDLFSLDDIKAYINEAAREAWDMFRWDFTEGSKTATLDATDVSRGYIPYPSDFTPSSIFLLKLDSKEQKKKVMADFLKTFEDRSASTDKIYAEYSRNIFLNANLMTNGSTVDVYGKLVFTPLSNDTDVMPFSPTTDTDEQSGNSAIVTLAYAKALSSEKKRNPQQGAIEEKRAYGVLSNLMNDADKGRSTEQSSRPMFDAPDYFGSASRAVGETGTFSWNSNN